MITVPSLSVLPDLNPSTHPNKVSWWIAVPLFLKVHLLLQPLLCPITVGVNL